MSANELAEDAPAPRLCHLFKWDDFDGYGFNLHAEKSKAGQYIGKVDEGSPAKYADLREGDCIVEVNGVNIANENHKQVVERIKAVPNETRLLVIDEEAKKWYKERKLVVKGTQHNVIYNKTPVPRPTDKDLNGNRETINGHLDHVTRSDSLSKKTEEVNHKEEEEEKGIVETPKEVSEQAQRTNSLDNSEEKTEDRSKEEVESSRSSTPQSLAKSENLASGGSTGSVPDSPQSFKSSNSQTNDSKVTNTNGTIDLNLNMSASEMRQLLASRKKHDPKKIQMDLKKKYDIIQQM